MRLEALHDLVHPPPRACQKGHTDVHPLTIRTVSKVPKFGFVLMVDWRFALDETSLSRVHSSKPPLWILPYLVSCITHNHRYCPQSHIFNTSRIAF